MSGRPPPVRARSRPPGSPSGVVIHTASRRAAGALWRPGAADVAGRLSPVDGRRPGMERSRVMILVAGATGMLGSLITRRLLEQGRDVHILVRPQSAYVPLLDAGA